MEQRIQKLRRLDNMMGVFNFLRLVFAPEDHASLKERILNATHVFNCTRRSRAYGRTGRVDYLRNLINRYDNELAAAISKADEVFIVACVSAEKSCYHSGNN